MIPMVEQLTPTLTLMLGASRSHINESTYVYVYLATQVYGIDLSSSMRRAWEYRTMIERE